MHHRNVAAPSSNESSSFPLVDFISRWRLRDRGQTAPATTASESIEATDEETPPLLLNRFSMAVSSPSYSNGDNHDVPYPLPDAFLLPTSPAKQELTATATGEATTASEFSDDDYDDDAQSIKSYGSDQIRTYDRLSVSRVSSSEAGTAEVKTSWPHDVNEAEEGGGGRSSSRQRHATGKGLCPFSLSRLCLATSATSSSSDIEPQSIEMQRAATDNDNSKSDTIKPNKKKNKKKAARSVLMCVYAACSSSSVTVN